MKKILFTYGIITCCVIIGSTGVVKQGISGKIYEKQGNYMPSPGQKPQNGKVLSTDVFVYQLTNLEQVTANGTYFTNIKTKLIAKSHSDKEGFYSIALAPGSYSVFVNDGGQLYANSFDGKGNINKVIVKADSVTTKDITISSKAVY